MPFDWMHVRIPAFVIERNQAHRIEMHREEVRIRSSLLRRLGYPQEYALHRCLGNQEWGFEMAGECPLRKEETREIVAKVYQR